MKEPKATCDAIEAIKLPVRYGRDFTLIDGNGELLADVLVPVSRDDHKQCHFNGEQITTALNQYQAVCAENERLRSVWRYVETEMPPHDGDYLCTVRLLQECGSVWIRQEVIWCSMNQFPERVIAWKPLTESAEVK